MLHGVILPREQRFDKERWANDILNKCYFDDHLWGYMIRIMEELHVRDPAMNQSTQAMRLATALASRIIWIANTDRANVSDTVSNLGS